MASQRIRIRLRSYDHAVLDQSAVLKQQEQQQQMTADFAKQQAEQQQAASQQAMQQAMQAQQAQAQAQQAQQVRQSYDFAPSYNPPSQSFQSPAVQSLDFGDASANLPGTPDFFSESPVADPFFAAPGPSSFNEGFADYDGGMGDANLAKARSFVQASIDSARRTVEGAKAAADKSLADQNKAATATPLWKKLALAGVVGVGGFFGWKAWKSRRKGRR